MNIWKGILHLIIIYSLLFTGFFLASGIFNTGLVFKDVLILLTSGLLFTIISLVFFHQAGKKDNKNMTILTMAAFGIKMALYLILLLVFYFSSKIEGTKFIITFFIIYLSFTVYFIRFIIKTLTQTKTEV